MKKRSLSMFILSVMLIVSMLPITNVNAISSIEENLSDSMIKNQTSVHFNIECNGKKIKEKITFVLKDKEGNEEYSTSGEDLPNGLGQLPHQIAFIMQDGKDYILELAENDEYDMEPIRITLKEKENRKLAFSLDENSFLEDLKIIKKIASNVEDEFNENNTVIKTAPLRVSDGGGWNSLVKEEVTFKLFNSTKQRFEGVYKSNDKGHIPPMNVIKGDKYILSLKENSKYSMPNQYFIHYEDGNLPEKLKSSGKLFMISLNPKEEDQFINERVRITIPVKHYGKSLDNINLSFISEIDKVNAISKDGKITVDLLEDITYVLEVNDDIYTSEIYPLVIKDKSELGKNVGKNLYNHSNCEVISSINLIKKTQQKQEGAVKSKSGKTIIYGPKFNNLRVNVVHMNNDDIDVLKDKNVEIYKINLMNPFREEVTKYSKGDFIIERFLEDGVKVNKVFELKNNSELSELDFKQSSNKVTFKTDSLSVNPVVFEFKKKELKTKRVFLDIVSNGKKIEEEVAFILKDSTGKETYCVSGSKINGLLSHRIDQISFILKEDEVYELKLSEHDNFEMKELKVSLKQIGEDYKLVDLDSGKILENLTINHKKTENKKQDLVLIPIMDDGNFINESIAFLIKGKDNDFELIKKMENMMLMVSLEEGTYSIRPTKEYEKKYIFSPDIMNITIKNDKIYILDDKGELDREFNLEDSNIVLSKREELPTNPDDKPIDYDKIKELNFRLIDEKGKTIPNTSMALYKWDYSFVETGIPSIVRHLETDENGNLNIGNFEKNSKYELRLRDSSYITNQFFTIITDQDANVVKVNGRDIKDNSFDFLVTSPSGEISKDIHKIKMYAKDKDGNDVTGAEFAASVVSPKLYEYKRVISKDGEINFMLEDGVYGITVSKRGMFYYDFEPSIITIEVIDGEAFVVDEKVKVPLTESNGTFILTKVDKITEKDELRALIEDAKVLLEEDYLYDQELIEDLRNKVNGAEKELENEHTSPHYIEGFIESLKKSLDNVRDSLKVIKEHSLVLNIKNDKLETLSEDVDFYISGITNQTCMKEMSKNGKLSLTLVEGEYSIRPTEKFEERYSIQPEEINILIKSDGIYLLDENHKVLRKFKSEDSNVIFKDKLVETPEQPVEPETPEIPVEPEMPGIPVEPETPEKPEKPEKPVESDIKDFKDVSKNYWGYEQIKKLQSEKIIEGYSDGTLRPNNNITRGEAAALVARIFNINSPNNKIKFKDVDEKDWCYDDVMNLTNVGLIKGYSDKSFRPNKLISREELIAILVRAVEYKENKTIELKNSTFEDEGDVSNWAKVYIKKAVKENILLGYPDNTIRPKNNITRMEVFSLIYNIKESK